MNSQDPNYLSNWKPGDDICFVVETKSQDGVPVEKTAEEINELFGLMECVANNMGFHLSTWGLRPAFESSIKKRYVRAIIKETVIARDLQLSQIHPELKNLTRNPPPIPEIQH